MKPKVLVAGIGNVFFGDDAFGIEVVNRLAQQKLPEGVNIADYGIRSYDLAYALMEEWDRVILIDALPRGGTAGTLYVIEPQIAELDGTPPALDAHTMDPVAVLQLVAALGGKLEPVIVVGCEPASIGPDSEGKIGLSPPVGAAVNEAVGIVLDLISDTRTAAVAQSARGVAS